MTFPALSDIRAAHQRIAPYIHRTPVMSSQRINRQFGTELYFKCENLQKIGAFKARGACNAVMLLDEAQAQKGVVTHSSGNHGAAVAWAASLRNISATIVVPENAPLPKKRAIEAYGGKIVPCAPNVPAREAATAKLIKEQGLELIHPYNDVRVITGQGTAGVELLEEIPELDIIITPTGGGGLLSGTALAGKGINPNLQVIGAEPAGSDDAYRSFHSGTLIKEVHPQTICDGLRSTLGEINFAILQRHVDTMITASEQHIIQAMRLIWESMKIIVEPSACPPLAAILEGKLKVQGKKIGIILSGGNLDLEKLPWQH